MKQGNQNAAKEVTKDATLTIRLHQSSKDKAARDAEKAGQSVSAYVEQLIKGQDTQ